MKSALNYLKQNDKIFGAALFQISKDFNINRENKARAASCLNKKTLMQHLMDDFDVPTFCKSLDNFFRECEFTSKKPLVILVDQLEKYEDLKQLDCFIDDLALGSNNTQRYVVVAICSDRKTAETALMINNLSKSWPVVENELDVIGNKEARGWRKTGIKLNEGEIDWFVKQLEAIEAQKIPDKIREEMIQYYLDSGSIERARDTTNSIILELNTR